LCVMYKCRGDGHLLAGNITAVSAALAAFSMKCDIEASYPRICRGELKYNQSSHQRS